ncbi:hypothetical protein Dimus_024639 [Dionaea muscipula]
MTVRLSNKKDVATTRVRGVKIERDCMTLTSILKIPGKYGLSDYVKEVWEEVRYCKPLKITRKFSNDETITKAGRVSSSLMKPFQRMGEQVQKEDEIDDSGSGEKFYDAVDDEGPVEVPDVVVPAAPEVPVVLTTLAV